MKYEFYHYNHIGRYACPHCGHQTPEAQYVASGLDPATGDYEINGCAVHTDYVCLSNILNSTSARWPPAVRRGFPSIRPQRGWRRSRLNRNRYDTFPLLGRPALMILSKNQNPVSYDQSIDFVAQKEGDKTVLCYVNNINHTNHKDTTWLYDVSFERLNQPGTWVVCAGPRAYDLALRLELGGFDMGRVFVEPEVGLLRPLVEQKTKGTICILTEIYDSQRILSALKGE